MCDFASQCKRFGFYGTWFRRVALLSGLAVALLWPGAGAARDKSARKHVRIPCQEFNRLMIVDADNRPVSGYAYDYIETIATYAGWDVEYVPSSSFTDCVRQLLEGEADLFYEISYTDERTQFILYPDEPMGFEYYYLYSAGDNASIVPDDYSTLQGRTAGVTAGTMQIDLLKQWCAKKNVDLQLVEYVEIPRKEADLAAGKIDLDLEVSMVAQSGLSAVEKIGSSAYYLVAAKGRPDLVADINFAMEKVLGNDPYFFSRLQERYFSDTVLSRNLTSDEKDWIAEHRVLRVGFFDHYLPFSALDDNGEPAGAAIEAVKEIVRSLGLEDSLRIEFICFDDQKAGYKAVESGAIDVMLPAYISHSVKQDYRIIGGKSLAMPVSDLTFLNDYGDGKEKRLGVNRHNLMQYYYSKDTFPHSEIVLYDDIRGCLDGLLEGTSDGTFLNGVRAEALLKPDKYRSLHSVRAKNDFQLYMAFAEDNIGLMLLMDRGLTMLDSDFINKASYAYVGRIYTLSAMDILREHIVGAIATASILVALLVLLVATRISNRRLSGVNQALVEYAETIEEHRLQEADLRRELENKQHELQDALRMAQAANRAKTTFLSNMSHDIRTPMNAIIGFTGLAANHLHETECVRNCLSTISQSSEHLLSLINDVLEMSRIEAGKIELHEKAEFLADILRALRDIVSTDIQAKGHTFTIDTEEVRDEYVYCDKMRLEQVLLNLVSNAIKYTRPGGTISLHIVQKPSPAEGHGVFEFRCRDNGIGMSESFVRTLFDPFTREETSTVSGIQGTGLGMSITKHIVDLMGGSITVDTKKGEGTEIAVSVDFRIADRQAADSVPAGPEEGAGSGTAAGEGADQPLAGKRVLMVDDSRLNLKVGMLLLREQGLAVDTASDGQEAVERIREKGADAYDFVLMDVQMPVMDGYAATAAIRKLPGGGKLKIIAFSANAFEEDREKSLASGMDGHLAKPLKTGELVRELKRFLA